MVMVAKTKAVTTRKQGDKATAKYWANEINVLWRKTAEAYIQMGRLLNEAKKALKTSEWNILLDDKLDFDERKAQKLMKIAKHPILTAASHVTLLPPSYTTLETLARLDGPTLTKAFKKGDIHPNMERSDAEELVEMLKPKPAHDEDEVEVIESEGEEEQEDDDGSEDDDEPETKPSKVKDQPASTRVKTSDAPKRDIYDIALDNFDSAINLGYYAERLEEAMEKKGISRLPAITLKQMKVAQTLLGKLASKYS